MDKSADTKYMDPTGTILTPSFHGERCLGNGEYSDIECCCDECDFYLECFPDWMEENVAEQWLKKRPLLSGRKKAPSVRGTRAVASGDATLPTHDGPPVIQSAGVSPSRRIRP